MTALEHIANSTIAKPLFTREVRFSDGDTMDIVAVIKEANKVCEHDTQLFAPSLKGESELKTLSNIWNFVKKNIRYQLDPIGIQWVKTPARTWADGFSDCKSRSLFQASLIKNLKLNGYYRFASYDQPKLYTHVYAVVFINGKMIVSDPDMQALGLEKQYKYKLDIPMSRIEFVAGIGQTQRPGRLNLHLPVDEMTDLDMELAIRKQREEIQKGIVESLSGIGCATAQKHDAKIELLNKMIDIQSNPTLNQMQKVSGIGAILEDANVGKIQLKKILKFVTAPAKFLTKLASAPARLALKGILEVALPKMAPVFLYLFIKDPNLIAALPDKARSKRKTAEKLSMFIIKAIGMKEDHFMGIIRNGIMKRFHKSPEEVINLQLKGKISGIGDVGIIDDIIKVVFSVIKQIMKLFKKKAPQGLESYSQNDIPDPSDFHGMDENSKSKFGDHVRNQTPDENSAPGDSTNSKSTKMC
jgi:hypothetical protein